MLQVGPVGLLYVSQREMAAIAPHDKNVHIIGSDDSTTCIIVVVRHSGRFACCSSMTIAIILAPAGSGAVAMAHLDGNGTDEAVTTMVGFSKPKSC